MVALPEMHRRRASSGNITLSATRLNEINHPKHKMTTKLKSISEYLNPSGVNDEELRVLIAETRGWTEIEPYEKRGHMTNLEGKGIIVGTDPTGNKRQHVNRWETSLDACRELLEDLTEEEWSRMSDALGEILGLDAGQSAWWQAGPIECAQAFLRATARQIGVAYLIVKGVLK